LEEKIRCTQTRISAFAYLEEISSVDRQDKNARICTLGTDNRYEQKMVKKNILSGQLRHHQSISRKTTNLSIVLDAHHQH